MQRLERRLCQMWVKLRDSDRRLCQVQIIFRESGNIPFVRDRIQRFRNETLCQEQVRFRASDSRLFVRDMQDKEIQTGDPLSRTDGIQTGHTF